METLQTKIREFISDSSAYRAIVIGRTSLGATRLIYECPHKHRVESQAMQCGEKKRKQIEKKREREDKLKKART